MLDLPKKKVKVGGKKVVLLTGHPPRARFTPRAEVYQDEAGEWRWRITAANKRNIANGGEGYSSAHKAVDAFDRLILLIRMNAGVMTRSLRVRDISLLRGKKK